MRRAKTDGGAGREPSWQTALAEADAAGRRVEQAVSSLERLADELRVLREVAETAVRLELARDLTEGPDGGVLTALATTASGPSADPQGRRVAEILLERLTAALGLEPVVERGTSLRLRPEELGEFEIRGPRAEASDGRRGLYRVMRPGWWLGDHIVVRPLLEPIGFHDENGRCLPPPVCGPLPSSG